VLYVLQAVVAGIYFECRCWISDKRGAIWAFVAPMLMVIMVIVHHSLWLCVSVISQANCFFLAVTMYEVYKSNHSKSSTELITAVNTVK